MNDFPPLRLHNISPTKSKYFWGFDSQILHHFKYIKG